MTIERCANCGHELEFCDEYGESSVFCDQDTKQRFMLCGPCWHREDALIEVRGTNVIPELLKRYKENS